MITGNFASALSLIAILSLGGPSIAQSASKSVKGYGGGKSSLRVCSGYSCAIKEKFSLTGGQRARLRSIMAGGKNSASAERVAVAKAIGAMETYARARLRYGADKPKASNRYNGLRGQMDCVDESLNTTAYLTYLHGSGWLRHHRPRKSYAERGFILDGRYPHKSAVLIENNGRKWAVDSWYKSDGKPPVIKPLKQWYRES